VNKLDQNLLREIHRWKDRQKIVPRYDTAEKYIIVNSGSAFIPT
jgi:hypothetical protein